MNTLKIRNASAIAAGCVVTVLNGSRPHDVLAVSETEGLARIRARGPVAWVGWVRTEILSPVRTS